MSLFDKILPSHAMVVGDKKKHLAVILTLKSLVDDNNQVSTVSAKSGVF